MSIYKEKIREYESKIMDTISQMIKDEDVKTNKKIKIVEIKNSNKIYDSRLALLVEHLEFSVRISNCLREENIITIFDLISKTKNELLRIPKMGKESVKQVEDTLKDMGLQLGAKNPIAEKKYFVLSTLNTFEVKAGCFYTQSEINLFNNLGISFEVIPADAKEVQIITNGENENGRSQQI
jgi:hypothetical protein